VFNKILIANRGEIALRIIQACRELGVRTVAVHSTADRDSLHVTYADEDVCIGPPASKDSYLNTTALLSAADVTGADAVHPGYGFLAENPQFAEQVVECGLAWIGPRAETIRLMGDKAKARQCAEDAGVPVLPGSREPLTGSAEAVERAGEVGYPVILKAAAGGGGRGMRIVQRAEDLAGQLATAREEAEKAFGDGSIYLEKYLTTPRHVEFQVFGDRHGKVVHLGERECSVQRRHQKLIEESPSPALTPELRRRMGEASLRLCEAVGYENAGTIEYLLDADGRFYFMEMNTRIQVEHPVTEMVTGVDLVKLQIEVAAGAALDLAPATPAHGHAIECRINAEHPERLTPSPGRLTVFHPPGGPGTRVDTHAYEDYVIPPFYDSLVAKLIVWDVDREAALARMARALEFFVVEGIDTSIPLHRGIVRDPGFRSGDFSTRFMEGFMDRFLAERRGGDES
jgi:acetyl-CoA carboxylase biotin carboxylase subunit